MLNSFETFHYVCRANFNRNRFPVISRRIFECSHNIRLLFVKGIDR